MIRPDIRALRAMSHPTRLQLLGRLRVDGPATASGLAQRLGLNSGATSYHLRQLGDAGLIEEDTDRGSKRDRWWRASYDTTHTDLTEQGGTETDLATLAFTHAAVQAQIATLQQADAERDDLPSEWLRSTTDSDWAIRLTPDRAQALVDQLVELLTAAATAPAPPEEEAAQPVIFQLHAFPAPGRVTRTQDDPA